MAKEKLRAKHLIKIGIREGKAINTAISLMDRHLKKMNLENKLDILQKVVENPDLYLSDEKLSSLAETLISKPEIKEKEHLLLKNKIDYPIYGAAHIEDGAIKQMEIATRLPITIAGALMPDAHQGYGLLIGGVLATDHVIIPYAVGMDIGCRMALSVFEFPENYIYRYRTNLKQILHENTRFGNNSVFDKPMEHEVLERDEFKTISILRQFHHFAVNQIGTSGSGNHFVEFGDVTITTEIESLKLKPGKYLGVLSHSGSRHFGYEIAQHFTRIAMEKCKLPNEAKHLAWLDMNKAEGLEYWIAMNLAGDYSAANHQQIHKRIAKALGEKPIAIIENHHNFAWKEKLANGKEAIIHRKGATPAHKDVLGLIPGSMASHGYIVKGKGNAESLNSCSHGAGRAMSRNQATASFSKKQIAQQLESLGIELIGGGTDEAPLAYKDIHKVMNYQTDLVEVLGSFFPRIVRMDG